MYLAFSSITRDSALSKMTRSDQMEEESWSVDLNFPETAFYRVIFLIHFKLNVEPIKSHLFYC